VKLDERVARLEATVQNMKDVLDVIQSDIRWIRQNMALRSDLVHLTQRVNGLYDDGNSSDGSNDSNPHEYIRLIIQFLLQGTFITGLVYVLLKFVG